MHVEACCGQRGCVGSCVDLAQPCPKHEGHIALGRHSTQRGRTHLTQARPQPQRVRLGEHTLRCSSGGNDHAEGLGQPHEVSLPHNAHHTG